MRNVQEGSGIEARDGGAVLSEDGPTTQRIQVRISAKGPEFPREKAALLVNRASPFSPKGSWNVCLPH